MHRYKASQTHPERKACSQAQAYRKHMASSLGLMMKGVVFHGLPKWLSNFPNFKGAHKHGDRPQLARGNKNLPPKQETAGTEPPRSAFPKTEQITFTRQRPENTVLFAVVPIRHSKTNNNNNNNNNTSKHRALLYTASHTVLCILW